MGVVLTINIVFPVSIGANVTTNRNALTDMTSKDCFVWFVGIIRTLCLVSRWTP